MFLKLPGATLFWLLWKLNFLHVSISVLKAEILLLLANPIAEISQIVLEYRVGLFEGGLNVTLG
mgnify:CR=1 FL=1